MTKKGDASVLAQWMSKAKGIKQPPDVSKAGLSKDGRFMGSYWDFFRH
jgi:hypothetical protein